MHLHDICAPNFGTLIVQFGHITKYDSVVFLYIILCIEFALTYLFFSSYLSICDHRIFRW